MKRNGAVSITVMMAARQPWPVVEDVTIEGTHMLVILGNEVDTVIKYIRGGGVKMPQLTTYDDVAEDAAGADVLLAEQRASGKGDTTGEGHACPYNWKLPNAHPSLRLSLLPPLPFHSPPP